MAVRARRQRHRRAELLVCTRVAEVVGATEVFGHEANLLKALVRGCVPYRGTRPDNSIDYLAPVVEVVSERGSRSPHLSSVTAVRKRCTSSLNNTGSSRFVT